MEHTSSEPSGRVSSMNQHFWLQNVKIYHKNNRKYHFAKYYSLQKKSYQLASTQFLDDTKLKISSKNWCWQAGNFFLQAGIFGKVAFCIIFIIYFNILMSKVLVHWIDPTARFRCGVGVVCSGQKSLLLGLFNTKNSMSTDWVKHLNQKKTCFLLPLNKQRDWNILSRFDSLQKVWLSLWVFKIAIKIAFNCGSALQRTIGIVL